MKFIHIISLALLLCATSALTRKDEPAVAEHPVAEVAAAEPVVVAPVKGSIWNARLNAEGLENVEVSVAFVIDAKAAVEAAETEVAAEVAGEAAPEEPKEEAAAAAARRFKKQVANEEPVADSFTLHLTAHAELNAEQLVAFPEWAVVKSETARLGVVSKAVVAVEAAAEPEAAAAEPVEAAAEPAAAARFRRHRKQDDAVAEAAAPAEAVVEAAPAPVSADAEAQVEADLEVELFAGEKRGTLTFENKEAFDDFVDVTIPHAVKAAAEVEARRTVRRMNHFRKMRNMRKSTRKHAMRHSRVRRSTRHMLKHRRQ